jgi:Flp pilus assembly protein TadG
MTPRTRTDGGGQALTEFALVLPILLLMLFGLIDIGRYVYLANALNQASREGARVGSVAGWNVTCPAAGETRETCIIATVTGRIAGGAGAPAVTASCERQTGGGVITVPASDCQGTDLLSVQSTVGYTMLTPLIAQLIGPVQISGLAQVTVQS